eukprot:365975-Chlamydomonas_euryale.AAC.6
MQGRDQRHMCGCLVACPEGVHGAVIRLLRGANEVAFLSVECGFPACGMRASWVWNAGFLRVKCGLPGCGTRVSWVWNAGFLRVECGLSGADGGAETSGVKGKRKGGKGGECR